MTAGLIRNEEKVVVNNIIPNDFTSAICYGQTGSGKTTGFVLPNINERMKQGHGMLIYVYKGNFDALIKALTLRNGRMKDVVEIGLPWGLGINLLDNVSLNDLKDWFDSMYNKSDYWGASAFSFFISLYKGLGALRDYFSITMDYYYSKYQTDVNINQIVKYCDITNIAELFDDVKNLIAELSKDDEKPVYDEYGEFIDYQLVPRKLDKGLEFVLNDLNDAFEGLKNFSEVYEADCGTGNRGVIEVLQNIINYGAQIDSLNIAETDMDSIVNSNKIVIVNTELMGDNLARLFHICFTQRLLKRIRNNEKLVPWTIFIDEAHKIVTKETMPDTSVCRESCFEYFLCVQNKFLLSKALGIEGVNKEEELNILTQNIAHQLSFLDPTNYETSELEKHEFVYLENSKLAKQKGKSAPIFIDNLELENALEDFYKNSKILDKIQISLSSENIKYIKQIDSKSALVSYKDGSKKECKIILKSKLSQSITRAKNLIQSAQNAKSKKRK